MPWKLVADPSGYIFTWLVGYSALLGPIGGILIADYFVMAQERARRRRRSTTPTGEYRYAAASAGWRSSRCSPASLPSLPGLPRHVQVIDAHSVPPFLLGLYNYAWFVGFGIAFTVYLTLRKLAPNA